MNKIQLFFSYFFVLNIVLFAEFTSQASSLQVQRSDESQMKEKREQRPVYSPLRRKPYTRSTKMA